MGVARQVVSQVIVQEERMSMREDRVKKLLTRLETAWMAFAEAIREWRERRTAA